MGTLHPGSSDTYADRLRAFRLGLREVGFVEGENVAIEFRWAEHRSDRLAELASELARRPVTVIVTSGGTVPALAAKAALARFRSCSPCPKTP